jgi:hypothetical protein
MKSLLTQYCQERRKVADSKKLEVKVQNFILEQDMKAQTGSRGIALPFL